MNLNSPLFDNVLAIDERLKMLEMEVQQMDTYYQQKPPPNLGSMINNNLSGLTQQTFPEEQEEDLKPQAFKPQPYVPPSHQQSINQQIQLVASPKQQLTQQSNTSTARKLSSKKPIQQNSAYSSASNQLNNNNQQQITAATQQQQNQSAVGAGTRYQNLTAIGLDNKSLLINKIKPQISKQYEQTLEEGRPDFSILEQEFEFGDKFYEPQYFGNTNDIDGECSFNVRFRESESVHKTEQRIIMDVLKTQSNTYYDSFMF
ncbi:UNKNOWN [Stylonychia lemnae]|uniref:Uncharacterized protein n=1 Tax=Stylonychia lemnae TaxID=5949 RepID=A0A077ZSV0_STYLE|nr:UNKNOWN [Stylonychia lemnae]|eukprot:CDW72962.1 UNKNOWN [Stylonychia lemnae]